MTNSNGQPSSFVSLPIAKLYDGNDIRGGSQEFDDIKESFQHTEQLQNIVVRPVAGTDEFQVVLGHRRVRAARALGWATIDAKVVECDDQKAEQYALEENLRRKALPDESKALARLMELYAKITPSKRGGDRRSKKFKEGDQSGPKPQDETAVEKVAKVVGQSPREVRRKVKVGKSATKNVKKALAAKKITIKEAERLASLPPELQDAECAALIETKRKGKGKGALEAKAVEVVERPADAMATTVTSGDESNTSTSDTSAPSAPEAITGETIIAALTHAMALLDTVEPKTLTQGHADEIARIVESLQTRVEQLTAQVAADDSPPATSVLHGEQAHEEVPRAAVTIPEVRQQMTF